MRVLALDPGHRVGWAAGSIEPDWKYLANLPEDAKPPAPSRLEVTGHGMWYLKDAALTFYTEIVVLKEYDAVVYETFLLTNKGARVLVGDDLQTSQFIGMVRLCCWIAGIPCYGQAPVKQGREARKTLKNDLPGVEQIRDIVAKADAVSHDDGHDGSAALHLWSFFFDRFV